VEPRAAKGRHLVGGAVLFLLAGCAVFGPKMEAPSVTISELHAKESTLLEQRFLAKLRIQNPNAFDLPFEGISYDLEVNGQPFAKGVGKADVVIPAYGQNVVETEAITTLMAFVRQIDAQARSERPKMSYRLAGKLKLRDRPAPLSFEMKGDDLFEFRRPGATQ
jgi:LEA14-like dessication related protein